MVNDQRWTFVGVIFSVCSLLLVIIPVFIFQLIIVITMFTLFIFCIYVFNVNKRVNEDIANSVYTVKRTHGSRNLSFSGNPYHGNIKTQAQQKNDDEYDYYKNIPIPFSEYFLKDTPMKAKLLCSIFCMSSLILLFLVNIFNIIKGIHESYSNNISVDFINQVINQLNSTFNVLLPLSLLFLTIFFIIFTFCIFKEYLILDLVLFKTILFLTFIPLISILLDHLMPNNPIVYISSSGQIHYYYFSTTENLDAFFVSYFLFALILLLISLISKGIILIYRFFVKYK